MPKQFMDKPFDTWPRLTETLPRALDPKHCQACGMAGDTEGDIVTLWRWREHDQFDKPEHKVVILCKTCEDALIEKHPRLYARIDRYAPEPGTMNICIDCPMRLGLACKSPLAQQNGGEGMTIIIPKPSHVHVQRSPRRLSGWMMLYPGPARDCSGKNASEQPIPATGAQGASE